MAPELNPKTVDGFILTRQWRESRAGLELVYWFSTEHGVCRLRLVGEEAVCFIPKSQADAIIKLLRPISGWRIQQSNLKNFNHQAVAVLYFQYKHDWHIDFFVLFLSDSHKTISQGCTRYVPLLFRP